MSTPCTQQDCKNSPRTKVIEIDSHRNYPLIPLIKRFTVAQDWKGPCNQSLRAHDNQRQLQNRKTCRQWKGVKIWGGVRKVCMFEVPGYQAAIEDKICLHSVSAGSVSWLANHQSGHRSWGFWAPDRGSLLVPELWNRHHHPTPASFSILSQTLICRKFCFLCTVPAPPPPSLMMDQNSP
jgi:hypothetical protein